MANVISDETIEYVGILAKLELSEEEKERAKKDMEEMLAKFSKEILPGFTCKWTPQPNNLESAEQFGFDFAQSILEEEHEECHCAD